jgi:hypothetical protein
MPSISQVAAAIVIIATSSGAAAQEAGPAVSLERIRRALDGPQPVVRLPPAVFDGDQPTTFRVEIFAPRDLLVPFGESLDPGWQAVSFGGIHHKEIMDMITPPQARPFGAYQDGDLAAVVVTSVMSGVLMEGVQRAIHALAREAKKRRLEAIRKEVEAELAAVIKASAAKGEGPRR